MFSRQQSVDDSFPKLKDFTFERKLGSGSYASVYKAVNKHNNDVCAVKCIKRSSLTDTSTENLLREIEILKNIRNDHIVPLKDFQWNDNYIYLIMEYCQGGDLSNFIKSRRTIPEKYVRRFLQQIAFALKHLHSLGIAHMDLKPHNILLTSTNNPSLKLGDFGFAQKLIGNTPGQHLKGSPLYMAPEILKYKSYDAKVDLWSVGVILYEVIFGYAPFISNSFEELEVKILDDKPIEIPSNIMLSANCKDLLKRLLQRNPKDRISFEQFFNHPFIDLDHMPSSNSFFKAKELFDKATKADEKKDYKFAQKCYLNGLEFLIPAIQYEKDNRKKDEMREKAQKLLKRAEEIANIKTSYSRPSSAAVASSLSGGVSIPIIRISSASPNNVPRSQTPRSPTPDLSTLTLNSTTFNDSHVIGSLMEACANNETAKSAIQVCLKADLRAKNGDISEETLINYQMGIQHLLPFLQTLPKESDASKVLKKQIDKWLCAAESIKEKIELNSQMNNLELIQAEEKQDEDNSPHTKQCIVQ